MRERAAELLFRNKHFHAQLWRMAKHETHIEWIQEDLVQEAWYEICQHEELSNTELLVISKRAIHTAYMRWWRYWREKKLLVAQAATFPEVLLNGTEEYTN